MRTTNVRNTKIQIIRWFTIHPKTIKYYFFLFFFVIFQSLIQLWSVRPRNDSDVYWISHLVADILTALPDIHGLESDSVIFSHRDESWMDLIQFCYLFFAVRLETLKRRLCNVMSGDIVELKAMMAVSSPTKKGHKENGNHNHGVESSKVGFLQLWCFQAWQAELWILWFTIFCVSHPRTSSKSKLKNSLKTQKMHFCLFLA